MSDGVPDILLEYMPDRVSEYMSDRNQNICQVECQKYQEESSKYMSDGIPKSMTGRNVR